MMEMRQSLSFGQAQTCRPAADVRRPV